MKHRWIALLMSFLMIFSTTEYVFANSLSEDSCVIQGAELDQELPLTEAINIIEDSPELYECADEIFEDVDNFDSMSISTMGNIEDIAYEEDQLTYSIDYGVVEDDIKVLLRSNEYTEYQVIEGDKTDSIIYYEDGTVCVNGEVIEKNADEYYIHTDDYSDWWSSKCPYGKSSDYTYKIGSKNNSNVENTKYWQNLTYTAFSLALSAALWYFVCPYSGFISNIVSTVFSALSYDDTPYTKHMSFKLNKYYHKNKTSGVVSGTLRVTKFYVSAYAGANYTNYIGKYADFYCKENY